MADSADELRARRDECGGNLSALSLAVADRNRHQAAEKRGGNCAFKGNQRESVGRSLIVGKEFVCVADRKAKRRAEISRRSMYVAGMETDRRRTKPADKSSAELEKRKSRASHQANERKKKTSKKTNGTRRRIDK